jgi:amidase
MSFSEYAQYDGLGLGELVRSKQVTAAELLAEAQRRVARLNPVLNAVVFSADELAQEWAKAPASGAFQGVPLLLKDILGACEGMPTRLASRSMAVKPARRDCELVARYRRAGFVPFGKTNVPEFGLLPVTESGLYAAAKNPWNQALSSGGSSGGAAAAVAAGIVPIAHGNDGGGSIRIPAACCGVVGLKPTRGRNSLAPGSDPSGLVCEHVLTRTVRDSAAALDASAGSIPGDFSLMPAPTQSYLSVLEAAPGPLRIAVLERAPGGTAYSPECASALRATADRLSDLGHQLTVAQPELNTELLFAVFSQLWDANAAVLADGPALVRGDSARREDFDPTTWAMVEAGRKVTAAQYQMARFILDGMTRRLAGFMSAYDVLLSPTVQRPALRLGELDINSSDMPAQMKLAEAFVAYAPIANAAGLPAISLPLQMSADGLPIGMQFMAASGEEALLLRLGRQLEQAMPWHGRHPELFG